MRERERLLKARRIVVKIGSSLLTADGQGLDRERLSSWVEQVARLWEEGREVVLVSSGAVAEGMARLGWRERPRHLHQLQAAAAVGQAGLVEAYQSHFRRFGRLVAQLLLTHEDLADRRRYLNARSTLATLLELEVVPVINENDTVVTDEIRFGDNDTLAALVTGLLQADLLLILTDQPGIYTRDPGLDPSAEKIEEVWVDDPLLDRVASGSRSGLGRGGMITKVQAARLAARFGAVTVIASGREEGVIVRVARGEPLGTLLLPRGEPLDARRRWLLTHRRVRGRLHLDEGAARAILEGGKSLLPIGVKEVEGSFQRGDLVACIDPEGREIARGLVNYSAEECRKLRGEPSYRIAEILGYVDEPELIHRDNLVLL